jgi:hypothetical protein
MRLIALISLLTACAGCTAGYRDYIGGDRESNYLSFQHAFTETAAENIRKRAERHCAEFKQAAVKTRSTCTMTECSTDYQCMSSEEAARFAPPDFKKK